MLDSLRFVSATTLVVFSTSLATPLWAQVTDARGTARGFANAAADAIAAGDHDRAEKLLGKAYEAYPAPTIALLHGRTLVRLGRLAQAVNAYERAAMANPAPDSSEAFRSAVSDAKAELASLRPRVPRLQVSLVQGVLETSNAIELSIDGERLPASQWGRWVLVDPGLRVIRVQRAGSNRERAVRLNEGESAVVDVSAPPPHSSARWLTLGSLGLGVAGLGVGVVSGLRAASARDKAYAACDDGRCVEGTEGARQLKEFRQQRTLSTVGYSVGAAGLAFGGYLLLRGSFDGPKLVLDVDVGANDVATGAL